MGYLEGDQKERYKMYYQLFFHLHLSNYFLFSLLFASARADINIVNPTTPLVLDLSALTQATIDLQWIHDSSPPKQEQIAHYGFVLCKKFQDKVIPIINLPNTPNEAELDRTTVTINKDMAMDGVYYIQVTVQSFLNRDYTMHYTPPITLTGMKNEVFINDPRAKDNDNDDLYYLDPEMHLMRYINTGKASEMPYYQQSGRTKTAPMQRQPFSTLRLGLSDWTMANPRTAIPSLFREAVAFSVSLVETTLTPGLDYVIDWDFNYASAAPMPSENGGWYVRTKPEKPRKVNQIR